MRTNRQILLTACLGASLTGLLAGCSTLRDKMARSTTQYNLVVEKAQNEMLLLNIVRARERHPMYFTSFGALRGKMTYNVQTGSMSVPFGKIGGGADTSYSIAPSAGYTTSPEFDLAVLDTKKFTNGIMMPVPMRTIEYYWQQGWPKEMLLHLFIRRIEMNDTAVENYPENWDEFKKFQRMVRKSEWSIVPDDQSNLIGEVDASEASKVQNLVEVQKAGLRLTLNKEKNKMELRSGQIDYVFKLVDRKSKRESQPKVYLRSPEAILYYLGEILRVEDRTAGSNTPMIKVSGEPSAPPLARLFFARRATDKDKTPYVSVDYEGTQYVIPEDPNSGDRYRADRSMHVLSLVSQLIGLQKEIEQTPVTGVVSVIGQ